MEDLVVAAGDTSSNVDANYNDAEIAAAAANGVDGASQRGSESSKQHEQSSRKSVPDNEHDLTPEESLNAVPPNVAQDAELGLGQIQDSLEDPDTRASGQDSEDSGLEDSIILSSLPQTLHNIEVVLRPPPDPESYERIRPSRTVLRVLEEVLEDSESGDEGFYTIEFEDGRINNATYEELSHYRGGQDAIKAYESSFGDFESNNMAEKSNKRPRSTDAFEASDSDSGLERKRRRHPTRESIRQTSCQASAGPDSDSDEPEYKTNQLRLRSRRSVTAPTTGRVTRNRVGKNPRAVAESDDELAQDHTYEHTRNHTRDSDDDDDFFIVRSDLAPQRRSSKMKKGKVRPRRAQPTRRREGSDSSIGYEQTRRSGRANKNTKSMKDPDIDEYYVVEERQTDAPKHVAIKEVFQPLAPDSSFRTMHSDTCESCLAESGGTKNPLVHCQGCSFSYHKACIGPRAAREHRVTKVGHEDFVLQCKFCIQSYRKKDARAPDHTLCQTCKIPGPSCAEFSTKKTPKQEEKARMDNGGEDPITEVDPLLVNNADNVLFRCTNCKRGYHFGHLPALTTEVVDVQDVKENRLEEYSLAGWSCKDCIDTNFKIQSLVAWRPVDETTYRQGQTSRDYGEDVIEYLIKWIGRSHFHDTWMPGAWVFGVAPGVMRQAFHKRESSTFPKMNKSTAIEEEWLLADVLLNVKYRTRVITSSKAEDLERIEDITSVFVKFQGLSYEEVVWDEPPSRDSGAAWEAFVAAYDEYLNGKYFVTVPDHKMRERIALYRSLDFGQECELKSQPAQLRKGELMEYQMEGVNFLLYNFHQQQNVILADEMGLGKTVQIVAFISALTHSKPGCWPFLVVVPNSTCPNWRRELKQWAPDLRVVTYHGGKVAQDLAYRHELYPDGPKSGMKAHVVIMSYEAAANVSSAFYGVKWVGLIVDEGQRLKNEETTLYKSLQDMKIPCRILLTGTPLQNNKRELFNLLQFIDSKRNAAELDERYAELTKDNLPELHSLIRPYFLRRTKAQVLKFLPPMAQIILPVTMTVLQEKLSKSIMARNPELIKAIISRSKVKAGERKSMSNILSDLRQCLCHPFCFNSEIEDKTVDMAQMHRNLVEASPKLLLFEIMLPKLKERGHRVLIFSQYLHSLTILEDFLTGMDMAHARIDGNLSALEKQKRIDAFNAPNSPLFAMLLSTRAGGVGINLATADTVIIYDPDFNPHQDIQALSRAHRIGQKRKVLCFQLMTKNTVEEKIIQMGRKKMALDHALIESMDAKEEAGEDLESILKHGAAALFSDESKDKITYDAASVDKLLDRSQIENTDTGDDDSAGTQFSFARIWANDKGDLASNMEDAVQEPDPKSSTSIWENILKEREAQHERELAENQKAYGRGARRRGTQGVDYKTNRVGFIEGDDDFLLTSKQLRAADSDGSEMDVDDELYIDQNEIGDDDSDDDGVVGETSSTGPGKARAPKVLRRAVNNVSGPQEPTRELTVTRPKPPLKPRLPSEAPQIQFPTVPTQRIVNNNSHNPQPIPSRPHSLTIASNPIISPNPQGSVISGRQTTVPVPPQMPGLQFPAVQLPNGHITLTGWIGGGNPCALCYCRHHTANPCVDLNSQLSLRLALDRLRAAGESSGSNAARAFFSQRLQTVIAYHPIKQ
ncbi:PHD/FYVE-zinc-finger like domain-containing protein [Xylaria sp. FL0064]|nr:PHD/FYVE-zinc-finger like domain-containing protein [Xylaria sp. FL0064]